MRICKNCGATIASATPGSIVRCEFCGVDEQIPLPVSQFGGGGAYQHPQIVVARPSAAAMVIPFAIVGVVMAMGVGFGVYNSMRMQQAASEVTISQNIAEMERQQPTAPKVTLANIATIPTQGWETLDAPGMVGTLDAFDVVANYSWAQKVGLAWKPDAAIMRIDVDRVGRDGLVNLKATPDASVEYRIFSPKCRKDYEDTTATVDPHFQCELDIQIKNESGVIVPTVLKTGDQLFTLKYDKEMKSPVCTLQQVMQKLDKAKKLPQKPVFNAWADQMDDGSSRWVIDQIISGQDTIGYVNGTTCALE